MIARPKISQNEWKMTEIGASKVGNFAPFCCPGARKDAEVTAPEKTATDAITAAARSVALTIGAKCMVVFTSLGTTVRRAAKGRPPVPIRAGKEFDVASP